MRPRVVTRTILALVLLLTAAQAGTVILKNAFIEKFKNRATIDVQFEVDHAHSSPNSIGSDGDDGDLHSSGRAAEAGLPMVAEVVNASAPSQKAVLDLIHTAEPSQGKVSMSGAWRFWFEHPSTEAQVQGQAVDLPKDTNPAHCFEIHPITAVKGVGVLESFVPVPGFQAYDTKTAFEYYETLKVTVQATKTATTISAVKAKYNYADFRIELTSAAQAVDDGFFALAKVLDKEGNTVVSNPRRMVFVKGTAPGDQIRTARIGARFHVLGIPRVNLERISFMMSSSGGKQVTDHLPYEMIIVGIFP